MTEVVTQGHRWAEVTPDDHSGALYVIAFLTFTYSTITCLARYFVKKNILGLDDAVIFFAQAVNYIQFALLLVSLSNGLGQNFNRLEDDEYSRMASAQFGNQIILYLSLGSSKIATILLIRRLFPRDMKMVWNVCNIIIGACTIWTVLAALLVSVGCSPANTAPVVASQTCPTIIPRYKIVVITDAIIEVILVATPAYLCWQLQMSVFFKLQVLAVFAFRLPLIVLACTFLTTWIDSLSSVNPGISRTVPTLLQQSELCLSIITATIPCVNGFLRSFDTGSGGKVGLGSSYDHGNNSHVSRRGTNQESYAMSSLKRSQNRESWKAGQSSGETGKMRARRLAASCVNTNNKDSSEFDQEAGLGTDDESRRSSRELIIRKDVQWEVISEDKRPESRPNVPGSLRLPK